MTSRHVAPGTILSGKYRLIELVGGGGMGEVYRAEHVLAGRIVAVKLLRTDIAQDENLTKRFFQEAQAVNKIRHPNIVDVIDAGFADEVPYVVMEYLEGASLAAAVTKLGRLDIPTAVSVVMPMLDALDAAHRHGIIHRDLKPENIYIARSPHDDVPAPNSLRPMPRDVRVKILDFGIAKVLDSEGANRPKTHTGIVFGTPDYLSPEQASGDGVIDGRSDLFSVGTLLFELLTGKRPFEAKNAVAVAYKIVHEPAARIRDLGVGDARLQKVLDIALAKNPTERFDTAAVFADRLLPFASDAGERRALLAKLYDAVCVPAASPSAADLARVERPLGQPVHATMPAAGIDAPPRAQSVSNPTMPSIDVSALRRKRSSVVDPDEARPRDGIGSAPRLPEEDSASKLRAARQMLRDESPPRFRTDDLSRAAARAPLRSSLEPGSGDRESASKVLARPPVETPVSTPLSSHPASPPRPAMSRTMSRDMPAVSNPTPSRGPPSSEPSRRAPNSGLPWTPRPMPDHVKYRCHVRGTFPRAVSRWIERAFGFNARAEVLAVIPFEDGEAFRTDAFNALVWYDVDAVDRFMEATTAMLMDGSPRLWSKLARENFDRDLGPVLRPSPRVVDPTILLQRSTAGWGRIFDFGIVRVTPIPPKRAVFHVDGLDAASLAMRHAIVGTLDGMLRSAGCADVQTRILLGEKSFASEFEVDIGWRA